ncbi:MAG: hypothetical protein CVU07_09230 [Bacteroidetes bacterium HGW-Bacteroidetes-23]|nr:MAG: hypothetical protein CVU07_09230 [Bacteroidetes bacterium HGW-Bacteroidetes-23]
MKKLLFTNWHLMRWIRLIIAIGIAYHAITTQQYFFLFFTAFFLFQALLNTCSSGNCQIPNADSK